MLFRILSVLFLTAALCLAQQGTEGSILGIVHDPTGAVVPTANVTITNTETGLTKSTLTDANGYFQILALPRGFYSVQVASLCCPNPCTWRPPTLA